MVLNSNTLWPPPARRSSTCHENMGEGRVQHGGFCGWVGWFWAGGWAHGLMCIYVVEYINGLWF
jgi:hypothetical protein